MKLWNLVKKMRPLKEEEKEELSYLRDFVNEKRFALIKSLLKQKKIVIEDKRFSGTIVNDVKYPQIKALAKGINVKDVNSDIQSKALSKAFEVFASRAYDIFPGFIAPNIKGMEYIKKAASLMLFSSQPVHVLLLGDPGTGKTDVLRSVFSLAENSSFGLGSGTSGAGLVVTVKGDKIMKGLLPLADNGICCIDELNLMKEESRAGLYSAMEKGFVTYDKGGYHYKFDARVRVLATANPKGDKFVGKKTEELREELPFDSALLTRFHLIFFIRKPDLKEFKEISAKIVSQEGTDITDDDKVFIKDYIKHVSSIEVEDIPKDLQPKIVDFITSLKKDENKYLIEVSPRLTVGCMRLCKALAKMEGRGVVGENDIERVKILMGESLKV